MSDTEVTPTEAVKEAEEDREQLKVKIEEEVRDELGLKSDVERLQERLSELENKIELWASNQTLTNSNAPLEVKETEPVEPELVEVPKEETETPKVTRLRFT